MKAKLVGLQDVAFQDRSGESVTGVKAHIIYRQGDVSGLATAALWFPSDNAFYRTIFSAPIGCTLDLEYGPKNKIVDVAVLSDVLDLELNPVSAEKAAEAAEAAKKKSV